MSNLTDASVTQSTPRWTSVSTAAGGARKLNVLQDGLAALGDAALEVEHEHVGRARQLGELRRDERVGRLPRERFADLRPSIVSPARASFMEHALAIGRRCGRVVDRHKLAAANRRLPTMPPTQEMIDRALDCLAEVELESFSANPSTIEPFGNPATVAWSARRPDSCAGLAFRLNGATVPASGSRQVQPSVTTTFHLEAAMFGLRRPLGTVTVSVDTSGCFSGAIPEGDIRSQVQAVVTAFAASSDRIDERGPAGVEVEPAGIVLRLRFNINIDNFVDPDLDVDCTIQLRAESGDVVPTYRSFSVDVDWPWWVTGLSLGISKIVEEVVEDKIQGELRSQLLQAVDDAFDAYLAMIPSTHRLYSVATVTNQINFTVCPVTDQLNVDFVAVQRPTVRAVG